MGGYHASLINYTLRYKRSVRFLYSFAKEHKKNFLYSPKTLGKGGIMLAMLCMPTFLFTLSRRELCLAFCIKVESQEPNMLKISECRVIKFDS